MHDVGECVVIVVPGSAFLPYVASGEQLYDAYLSGSLDGSWHDFSVCRTYAPFTIPYGQFNLYPQAGTTWADGFRPTTVTVSGTDIDVFLDGGVINIYDTNMDVIGSGAPETPIALTWGAHDFGGIEIYGNQDYTLEICSITWT